MKFLGVHLHSGLSFDYHMSEICRKTSRKVCALAKVTSGISLSKKHTLTNVFFKPQVNYCPLTLMCHSHKNNNKISRLHERCLRNIYNDKRSSFNVLERWLCFDSWRNIKILATKMFTVSKNLAPCQIHEIFKLKELV